MRDLLFLSILAFLIAGCSPGKKITTATTAADSSLVSPFGSSFQKALYKATLDIRDNHLSGYLMVKKTNDSSLRMVFTNDIGLTIFDLEFSGGRFIRHYLFESMNKKAFVKILEQDFRAMLYDLKPASGTITGGSNPFSRYSIVSESRSDGFPVRIYLTNPGIKLSLKMTLIS
jgi:hypothetical protein